MNKTKYLLVALTAVTLLTILSPTLTYAQPPETVNIYAWTDKTSYDPGDSGKLTIAIRNDRTDQDLIIYNITITYPWFAYTGKQWEGNDTMTISPPATIQKNGGTITYTREFTVPSDGRAIMTSYPTSAQISIEIAVDKAPYRYPKSAAINIKSTPLYMSLENEDKVVTLFTILVVLLIVCTIIIAATIFLSARRPQVTWKTEEKG